MSLEDLVYELKNEIHKLQDSVQELKHQNNQLENDLHDLSSLAKETSSRFNNIYPKRS